MKTLVSWATVGAAIYFWGLAGIGYLIVGVVLVFVVLFTLMGLCKIFLLVAPWFLKPEKPTMVLPGETVQSADELIQGFARMVKSAGYELQLVDIHTGDVIPVRDCQFKTKNGAPVRFMG